MSSLTTSLKVVQTVTTKQRQKNQKEDFISNNGMITLTWEQLQDSGTRNKDFEAP